MSRLSPSSKHRPRELRRRVALPARLRSSGGWTDTCILNISSGGLLIHSARTGPQGSKVELCRGDLVIMACVVWQDGARAGLRSEERLPVEEIVSLHRSTTPQLTISSSGGDERRRRKRPGEARDGGRAIEFAAATILAVSLGVGAFNLVQHTLARPLRMIQAALGG